MNFDIVTAWFSHISQFERMSDVDYIGLGRRIKSTRREQDMTQEQLANSVGISLSFIGHIERGSRKTSLETLLKIANMLNTSLDDLLRDSLTTEKAPSSLEISEKRAEELDVLNELSSYVNGVKDPWND